MFNGCKVNRFYIKPQLSDITPNQEQVVKLIDSTSNHNTRTYLKICPFVVKLIDSTSNHNYGKLISKRT